MKSLKITPPEGYEIDREKSTLEEIFYKPIKGGLPTTWEEFCGTHPNINHGWYIDGYSNPRMVENKLIVATHDKNMLPTKELAEAMLALCQLIQLRDCYNDGWQPNWYDDNGKPIIICNSNRVMAGWDTYNNHILTFKNVGLRDKFLRNFHDLLEVAKQLL